MIKQVIDLHKAVCAMSAIVPAVSMAYQRGRPKHARERELTVCNPSVLPYDLRPITALSVYLL